MVTKINRASKNDSASEKEGNNSLTSRCVVAVDDAIKSALETFDKVALAATLGVILGVVHGRWEQFNRLFSELKDHPKGRIYAEAIRQQFVPRLHDEYASGGVRDPEDASKWLTRPVQFISFASDPKANGRKDGEYFRILEIKGTSEADKARAEHVRLGKVALEAAGEDGILALEWMTAQQVTRPETIYDIGKFREALVRELKKAAKSVGNPDSGISASMIEETMRAYGFDQKQKSAVRMVMDVTPAAKPIAEPAAPEEPEESAKSEEVQEQKAA